MAIGLDWLEQASKGKFSTEQVVIPIPAGEVGTGFYGRMQKTANRLLIGKGQAVTLKHVIPGEYVPGEGIVNTLSLQYGTGAIAEWDSKQVDGTLILIGDKRLLLSPLNTAGLALTAPILGDTITNEDVMAIGLDWLEQASKGKFFVEAAGVVYTFVAPLKTISPAGTAVLYDCNLRT